MYNLLFCLLRVLAMWPLSDWPVFGELDGATLAWLLLEKHVGSQEVILR